MIRSLILTLLLLFASFPLFAEEKEGGIIGTGVIGQITGLEKFEVSGMRFEFAQDIELKGVSSLEELRMGMTLALIAGRDGSAWQINTLQHVPLLTGPVTGPGEVMGVPVIGDVPESGFVEVDGFWSERGIIASRVAELNQRTSKVSGVYDGLGRVGQLVVQGLEPLDIAPGQRVTVTGQFVDGALDAESSMQGLFMDLSPDLVLLEGYFEPTPQAEILGLQGIAVASAETEKGAGFSALVRRCALNGRIDFRRSELTLSEQELVDSFCASASNMR